MTCSHPVESYLDLCLTMSFVLLSVFCLWGVPHLSGQAGKRSVVVLDSQISMPLPLFCLCLLLDATRSLSQGYWSGNGENGISFVGIQFEDNLQDILGSLLMLSWKLLVCASLSLQINRRVRGALLIRILKPLMKLCPIQGKGERHVWGSRLGNTLSG